MIQLRALLANRSYLSVWVSSVVSGLGDKIAVIALYLLVYDISGRAVNVGLLAAVQIAPAILIGPLAGLILDRYDRKTVMVWSDLGSAVAVALLPFAHSLWQIYLIAAVLATGRQFTGPARLAIVVDLVPDHQLEKANALAMITRNLVLLVGPALGGGIVALWGTSSAFWVDSATFLASAFILVSRRFSYLPKDHLPQEVGLGLAPDVSAPATLATAVAEPRWLRAGRDIRRGIVLIWRQPRLRFAFYLMSAIVFVTAMQTPLVVFFVKNVLARGDVDLGLILSAAGVGGILGALGGGVLRSSLRPLRTVTWLLACDGLLLIMFALGRNFVLALVLFALFGAIGTVAQICLATFLQRETPDNVRGRVFGWLGTIMAPLSLISVFLGSLAAEAVGVVLVLALSGLFEMGVGLAGHFRLPSSQATAAGAHPGEAERPREMAGEA